MELKIQSRKTRHNIIKKILIALQKISVRKVIYSALVFFISMSSLPFGTLPLGCAVFAAEYVLGVPVFYGILALAAGFAGGFSATQLISLALVMLIFSAADMRFSLKRSPLLKSTGVALSVLFCSLVPKLFDTLYLYDTILIFAEAGAVFLLSMALQKAKEELFCPSKTLFSAASLCAFAAFVVAGASRFTFGYVNFGVLLAAFVLVVFSFENGITAAMIAGMVCGVSLGLSIGDMPYFIMLFTLSALLSSAFAPLGKSVSAAGYVLCATITAFYSPSTLQGFVAMAVFSFSALAFTIMPKKFTACFSVFSQGDKTLYNIYKDYTINKLNESSATVMDVAKSFKTLSENCTESATASFFDRATARLCSECTMKDSCWRGEFHRTYTSFFVLTRLCEKHGSITYSDIPGALGGKCLKAGSISSVFNSLYDIYKVDRLWERKLAENREATALLLQNISSSIEYGAVSAAKSVRFLPQYISALKSALGKENIEKIFVYSPSKKEILADIYFSHEADIVKTEEICQKALGGNYRCIYSNQNFVRLSLFPDVKFETCVIQKAKNTASPNGDTALCTYAPNSQYALILSDGMGYGSAASFNSQSASHLAKKLIQSGTTPQTAAEIINGTLLLKSTEISFSSVDMALVNATNLNAQFYKMGAAPSFIKRGRSVETIFSTTLPAGSFTKSDISLINAPLAKGDMVIMVSDGVATSHNTGELENLISAFSGTCNEMADMLISYCNKNPLNDDITVMVTCIN